MGMRLMRVIGSSTLVVSLLQFPVVSQTLDSSLNQSAQSGQIFLPGQLDSLVAPIALYPDPLLGQILVASTYPLEIVEAAQWLRQNSNLTGTALQDAAQKQGWDPSVQALIVFPDVLQRLSDNVRWTTDLGNAFLAQEPDVMSAVQRMRDRAVASGKLKTDGEAVVGTQWQGNNSVVDIEPANPQVIYVPVYEPYDIWGPAYYPYPTFFYPGIPIALSYRFFGYSRGFSVGSFFPGWYGWNSWGWRPNWFGHTVVVNNNFFSHWRQPGFVGGARFAGSSVWQHDPGHRWSVPYPNRSVESRFHNGGRRFQEGGAPPVMRSKPSGPAFGRSQPGDLRPGGRGFATEPRAPGAVPNVPRFEGRGNRPNAPGFAGRPSTAPGQGFHGSPGGNMNQAPGQFRGGLAPRPPGQFHGGFGSAPGQFRGGPGPNSGGHPSGGASRGGGTPGGGHGAGGGHGGGGGRR
jgi:hypothetical protein